MRAVALWTGRAGLHGRPLARRREGGGSTGAAHPPAPARGAPDPRADPYLLRALAVLQRWGYLASYCRSLGKNATAYLFARTAAEIPLPKDLLFVDNQVYLCRARDEQMMAAHLIGRGEEAACLAKALFDSGHLPAGEWARVERIRALTTKTPSPRGGGMASCKG